MADVEAKTSADIEKQFKEYSVAEFFKKNRQMLGYSGEVRSLTTIVHEYVTNSLDACEDARILPEITVEVESLSASPRETDVGLGDGTTLSFQIDDEIARAATLAIKVDGIEVARGADYVIKYEKKGKNSFRVISFKKTPPRQGARIVAHWAAGHLRVSVEDNGTGIPKTKVGQALGQLLSGTKFLNREQKRGQQGIGASYATLFAQITTGKPIHVKTSIGDYKIMEADLTIDVKKNIPVLSNQKEYSGKFQGLRVEAEFSEVSYDRSEYGVYEYLRRTAIANPHAQLTLIEPNKEVTVFPRASSTIPSKAKPVQPHPLGLTTSDLIDMAHITQARKVSSFLTGELAKFSNDKLNELKALLPHLDLDKHPSKLEWKDAEEIVNSFKKIKFYNPDLDTLVPIGAEQLEKSLKNLLQPEHLKVIERKPRVFRGGIPFLVEAAVAYGGKAGSDGVKAEVMRFANRTPLLFDAGNDAITEGVKTIDWGRYSLKNYETMPVSLFVNFVSVYVPYTGAGKLAISPEEEIVAEIRNALMEAARDVSLYLSGLQKAEDAEKRKQIFFKYIGEVAESLEDVTGEDQKTLEEKLRKIAEIRTQILTQEEESGLEDSELDEETEEEIQEGS
ncbi:DNA topoisomerase VI subunit B [Candidatus Micrarchaeota archaeon]|nr:DNA topoisomerase VI subunit B [Candidatus Micrarchaeota archaeon]